MKITIESTPEICVVFSGDITDASPGVPARVWKGKTESGIEIICFITRIAVDKDDDCEEFERELLEAETKIEVDGATNKRN